MLKTEEIEICINQKKNVKGLNINSINCSKQNISIWKSYCQREKWVRNAKNFKRKLNKRKFNLKWFD